MLFALIPMLFFLVIYLGLLGLCIWVVVVFLKRQRERNEALERIAKSLEKLQLDRAENNEQNE